MKNIYFDSKYINPADLEDYREKLQQLACRSSSHGLNIETLAGDNDIYSLRGNKKARLLFSRKVVDGEVCYVVLEILEGHDYHRSRVLRGFFDVSALSDVGFEAVALSEEKAKQKNKADAIDFKPSRVSLYNHQALLLTDEQGDILTMPLPLALQGGPGSGKTCLAQEVLKQSLSEVALSSAPKSVLYLSKSKNLVNRFRSQLGLVDLVNQLAFETYQSLCQRLLPRQAFTFVGQEAFNQFADEYLRKIRKQEGSKSSKSLTPLINKLYQEVRIISGYSNLEEYKVLGARQSLFAKEKRQRVWDLYIAYQEHLEMTRQVDCAVLPLLNELTEPQYDLIVVDEAQDLSFGQLASLKRLAKTNQICFLLDANQRLYDVASHANYIQSKLSVDFYSLAQSFRCPNNILELTNSVLSYKSELTSFQRGKAEADRAVSGLAQQGLLGWHAAVSQLPDDIASLVGSPQLAVIAEDEHKAAAKSALPTPLIFSSAEIKGLEYPFVVLYRPFDSKSYKQLNRKLRSKDKVTKASKPIDAFDVELALKRTYVSCTRAQQGLFIVNAINHDNKYLLTNLQQQHPACLTLQAARSQAEIKATDWHQEIVNLIQSDNKEQALSAFGQNIKDHRQFKQWLSDRGYHDVCQWLSEQCEELELKRLYKGKRKASQPKDKAYIEDAPSKLTEDHAEQPLASTVAQSQIMSAKTACDLAIVTPSASTSAAEVESPYQALLEASNPQSALASVNAIIKSAKNTEKPLDKLYQDFFRLVNDKGHTFFEQLAMTDAFEHFFLLLKKSAEQLESNKRQAPSKQQSKKK